jgi:hypothetical protein
MLEASAAGICLSLVPSAIVQVVASPGAPPAGFLQASKILTGDTGLDPVLARRYWAAFARAAPGLSSELTRLSELAARSSDAEALTDAAHANGLDAAANALTAAWYTGTVGSGVNARAVAYADALMYATVADGLAPPT